MLKAVIFDMDGVIIDSEPIHKEVEKKIFKKFGANISEEEHNSYIGMTSMGMWNEIKVRHNFKQSFSVEELIEMEVKNYIELIQSNRNIKPINGVVELIDELHKNHIKLAIASSAVRKSIETVVDMFALEKYFEIRISGEDIKNGKPAPDIFLMASRHLGVKPKDCIVVEDSKNGVYAAKEAGMKCIGFSNPNSGNQDLSSADMIIRGFTDINYTRLNYLHNKKPTF